MSFGIQDSNICVKETNTGFIVTNSGWVDGFPVLEEGLREKYSGAVVVLKDVVEAIFRGFLVGSFKDLYTQKSKLTIVFDEIEKPNLKDFKKVCLDILKNPPENKIPKGIKVTRGFKVKV